jgi:DNA-binding transcriptional regulator YiaG
MQGSELKALREGMCMSHARLAEALGISRVMVGLMERGQAKIERQTELAVR